MIEKQIENLRTIIPYRYTSYSRNQVKEHSTTTTENGHFVMLSGWQKKKGDELEQDAQFIKEGKVYYFNSSSGQGENR